MGTASSANALERLRILGSHVVVIDSSTGQWFDLVRSIVAAAPSTHTVVFAVGEAGDAAG